MFTFVQYQFAEKRQNVFHSLTRDHLLEKAGHVANDIDAMNDLLTPTEKKDLFEGSETAIVEYEVICDVRWDARIDVVSTVGAGRHIAACGMCSSKRGLRPLGGRLRIDGGGGIFRRRSGRGEVVSEGRGRERRVGGGCGGCSVEGEKRGEDAVGIVVKRGRRGWRRKKRAGRKGNMGGAGLARSVHGGWQKRQTQISTRDRRYVIHQRRTRCDVIDGCSVPDHHVCVSMTYRRILTLLTAAHNFIETHGKVPDVGRVESSHRYPPIVCQVNMHLLHQCPALLRADPRETAGRDQRPSIPTHLLHAPEHANLFDDVVPVTGCLEFFRQQPVQLLPHRNDSACHGRYVSFPLSIHFIIC